MPRKGARRKKSRKKSKKRTYLTLFGKLTGKKVAEDAKTITLKDVTIKTEQGTVHYPWIRIQKSYILKKIKIPVEGSG